MAIPARVTPEQIELIQEAAMEIRMRLSLPEPDCLAEERIEIDALLISNFYNKNHDAKGRFTTGSGGSASARSARMRGKMPPRSTPAERAAAKAARTEELVAKWGEKFRPQVDHMLAWMDEFTPAEAEARRNAILDAVKAAPDTATMHAAMVDGKPKLGVYSAERIAAQEKLIEEYKKDVGWDDIPTDREAILSGGLGGAGKGTMLEAMHIDESKFVTIDPDGLKGYMSKNGMIPTAKSLGLDGFDPPIRPMELAWTIHEESSHLSKIIANMATTEGRNVILDNTMGSDSVFRKVSGLREDGYSISGVFVDVSVDMSVESALARHMNGTVRGGDGGRLVDPALAAAQAPTDDSFRSANAERFDTIKAELDKAVVIDNEAYVSRPSSIASSTWNSMSPEAQRYVLRNIMTSDKTQTELVEIARKLY